MILNLWYRPWVAHRTSLDQFSLYLHRDWSSKSWLIRSDLEQCRALQTDKEWGSILKEGSVMFFNLKCVSGWLLWTKNKKNGLSAINHLSIPWSFEECELERLKNVFIAEKAGRTINLETKPNLVLPSWKQKQLMLQSIPWTRSGGDLYLFWGLALDWERRWYLFWCYGKTLIFMTLIIGGS